MKPISENQLRLLRRLPDFSSLMPGDCTCLGYKHTIAVSNGLKGLATRGLVGSQIYFSRQWNVYRWSLTDEGRRVKAGAPTGSPIVVTA